MVLFVVIMSAMDILDCRVGKIDGRFVVLDVGFSLAEREKVRRERVVH